MKYRYVLLLVADKCIHGATAEFQPGNAADGRYDSFPPCQQYSCCPAGNLNVIILYVHMLNIN